MMNRAIPRFLLGFIFLISGNLFLASAVTDPKDVAALVALYRSLGSSPHLKGWRHDGGDPCGREQWRGVSCSASSVIKIKIDGMGIGGSLVPQLSDLMSLNELDLSYNNISGEIPSALPPKITYMDLSYNNISGEIPFALPSKITYMNIGHNSLSGSIGNIFTNMQKLEQLDLSFNHFSGDLPSSFSLLANLHELYLQDNHFTGSVNFLANLPLYVLYLENNHFSGFVPKQFQSIRNLRINGNLFPKPKDEIAHPPQPKNETSHSPLPSGANKNISHSPETAPSFSTIEVSSHHHKRMGMVAMAATVCAAFLALLAAGALIVHFRKNSLVRCKNNDYATPPYQTSLPTVTPVNLDQCLWMSSLMSSPLSAHNIKSDRVHKRKSTARKRQSLANVKHYSASDILAATKNYSDRNRIGGGPIGCIYRAEFPDGQMFAVKKINMILLTKNEEEEFRDQICNMFRLRHPYIANLVGCCLEQGQHSLVYEYATNGSLDDLLFSPPSARKVLSWESRVRISLGVAEALEYMHQEYYPPIAHGNIKATNILLDNELTPRICDCELTVIWPLVSTSTKTSEPPRTHSTGYNAPEFDVAGRNKIKSDVYSFGVVLLELLTGRRAFDSSRKIEEQHLVRWASSRLHDFSLLEAMIDPTLKGTVHMRVLSHFADIVMMCTQLEPEFRPQMATIADKLLDLSRSKFQGPKAAEPPRGSGLEPSFKTAAEQILRSQTR